MTKQVDIRIAGQGRIARAEITDTTTADEAKALAGCPMEYELSPTVGEPPFGKDEILFDRVKDGGKIIAAPKADAGLR